MLQARRAGRRADRGLPARRDRAARHRSRRVPRPQPEARLRPHDRLGPGRPVRAGRRPRHQLHRARRRARADRPRPARSRLPPLNLVGDFGGGGMLLAFGVVCALLEAQRSGKGQVVDAAMVDGAALLMTMFHALPRHGHLGATSAARTCSTPARHFYDVYETADGKYVSIGSIEPQFYAELLRLTGLEPTTDAALADGPGRSGPTLKERFARAVQDARPATSGARSWRAPTCASRRCCRWPRRRSTRTTSHREHVRRARRRRAAGAGAAVQPHARRDPASAGARRPAHRRGRWPTGASTPSRPSPSCARRSGRSRTRSPRSSSLGWPGR